MMIDLRKRLLSTICAAAMLFSQAGAVLLPVRAAEETSAVFALDETELCQQTFELYPNGEDSGQVVTLEGLMPEGASAEAVDVSDDYAGIAAYDITITGDSGEFQPSEDSPVLVEITDPSIPDVGNVQLWHIRDDGVREQIIDFTSGNGKISFYASGFSVYEIVADPNLVPIAASWNKIQSIDELDSYDENSAGLCIGHTSGYYFMSQIVDDGRVGIKKTSKSDVPSAQAVPYYFEKIEGTDDQFYIYCLSGGKQYLKCYVNSKSKGCLTLTADENEKTAFTADLDSNGFQLYSLIGNNKWYINMQGGSTGTRFCTYNSADDDNNFLDLWYPDNTGDIYSLDGKSYGLMYYPGGTHGYALMAEGGIHTLIELVTRQKSKTDKGDTLYVDQGSEVTHWKFHSAGGDLYTLSGDTATGEGYLKVSGDSLTVCSSADDASKFRVTPDNDGRVCLSCGDKYIIVNVDNSGSAPVYEYGISSDTSSGYTMLSLINFADLSEEELITYSADRISVSDVSDGDRVVVYTRIWDDTYKKYDIYAIDYNGTLYPCYASGGKILWLGDGACALEWIFTEYVDEVTKEPNYYYELFNPYSEKYIAPQLSSGQTLSDGTIGINMPGRRKGEFFSDIIAWDNDHYAYIGMKPNDEKTKLVPCSQSTSVPFYFAVLEDLNLSDRLHEVATVDNNLHGITMKMKDFAGDISKGDAGGTEQTEYLGYNGYKPEEATSGLLSTNLDDNGYPVAASSGRNLRGLYAGGQTVNHLFIESIHNSGGYFEFDSTQNFATLAQTNDNNFTVYRELGTSCDQPKNTLKHGQFFPYNNISAGNYSKDNSKNEYSADARPGNNTAGLLSEDNPRKYEKLYSAGRKNDIDYYFGMEMSAQFVQTVSGLDAWGHDIIFEFKGDDDFWFYVDGELVIDLGGIHSALSGKVNFRTGEVEVNGNTTALIDVFRSNYQNRGMSAAEIDSKLAELFEDNGKGQYIFKDYTTHNMRVFYMERGAGASNIHMRFNLASVTPGHVVVAKSISGSGADVLDSDFVEYPFQIYYTLPDEDDPTKEGEEKLLCNDNEHIRVTYQNSTQPVTFVKSYRPPGFSDDEAYKNIYFINPSKNAEIIFPEDTIGYRIVECAVDSTVYSNVLINGETVPSDHIEVKGDLKSYKSDKVTAKERPTITFDNFVQDNVIKDLFITKKVYDENNVEVTDDPETFNFRLMLSSVDVDADKIPAVNMYTYHVLTLDKKMCRYDSAAGGFVETGLYYSHEAVKALKAYSNDIVDDDNIWEEYDQSHPSAPIESYGLLYDDISYETSGFGAISKIPSRYTVCVPGLPVGSIFKVREDVKSGYGILGYECIKGEKINEDNSSELIASYYPYEGNPDNVGRVRAEENPQMEVKNRKGYGLTVNKRWSDLEITTYHAPVYTAVYVDGELLSGSVRQIASPSTSAYYFWTSLEPKANGDPRSDFDGYEVREVTLSGEPVVSPDGTVSGYTDITPLDEDDSLELTSIRTANATPVGEEAKKNYDYVVTYKPGEAESSTRTDTITNNREGGIALRLFKWDSDVPLEGGSFTLYDSSGKTIGKYNSDAEGKIAILYNYEPESVYTLVQTSAPKGYVGLQKKLKFIIHYDETAELLNEDGTPWGENKWVDWKHGESGLTAFVDVYNKHFNFKIVKTDSSDSGIKLGAAHFALYKRANTNVSGYVKNRDPLTGFEDMKTVNGEVDVCGGNSGRVIDPGQNGSVYFLTETYAPPNYSKLDDDIVFRISPLGVPSLISDSYNGELYEADDSYIYTLSVPNERVSDSVQLSIKKQVKGSFADATKEFTFTITVSGAAESDDFTFTKNDIPQPALHSGGTFKMKHNDIAVFTVPVGTEITVTEDSEGYEPSFRLGDDALVKENELTFELYQPQTLIVTNTLSGSVPTGISTDLAISFLMVIFPLAAISVLIWNKRKDHSSDS